MKISREFAQILIDLLKGQGDYDKQKAIEQLESAIEREIHGISRHKRNSSITPFLNSNTSVKQAKEISNQLENEFEDDK